MTRDWDNPRPRPSAETFERKIIQLREPKDEWQFTVEVVRRPDGQLHAHLLDARQSLIESGESESHTKLHEIAEMLSQSIGPMRADAESLKP